MNKQGNGGKRLSYKIVGDNIDKNVRPSYQRIDISTRSLHYFRSYAVRDRVDTAGMSEKPLINPSPGSILPSASDSSLIFNDFKVLISW